MKYIIKDEYLICQFQKVERIIYKLDNFNPRVAAFPKKVFKEKFDIIVDVQTIDFFHSQEDFDRLIAFLVKIGSESFIASCPPYNLIAPIKVPVTASFTEYVNNHTYIEVEGSLQGIGLRKSAETFYYDTSKKWAIVNDLTNDVTIVGLKKEIFKAFEKIYAGFFSEISFKNAPSPFFVHKNKV